jgi:uncharacterized protein
MPEPTSLEALPAPQLAKPAPRIDALDLLRGIAILGIFLMNTWTMSLPQDTYTNPATYNPSWVPWDAIHNTGGGFPVLGADGEVVSYNPGYTPLQGINHWVYVVIHLFADMKFITTFSILFGAGIVLQAERSRKKGHNPWLVHYMRMSVLLMFGLVHTFGFWYGDILTDYALAGLILAPVRMLPAWLLFLGGMAMVAVPTGMTVADEVHRQQVATAHTREDMDKLHTAWYKPLAWLNEWDSRLWRMSWQTFKDHERALGNDVDNYFPAEDTWDENNRELQVYRGSWWDQVVGHRFWCSVIDHTTGFLSWTFWRCGGCFLLGMALQKRRFFHAAWPKEAYATLATLTIPVGWIISYLGVMFNQRNGWIESEEFFSVWHLGAQFNYWGSLLCSFGYMSLGVLLAMVAAKPTRALLSKCLTPIRSIGRMALTCYLTETLIGTTIYYGHGFGLFGKTTRVQNLPIVLGTWAFLLIFAPLWLTIFRQGPLEWFWHSIVYWDWKNPLKAAAGPDASLSPSVRGVAGQTADM